MRLQIVKGLDERTTSALDNISAYDTGLLSDERTNGFIHHRPKLWIDKIRKGLSKGGDFMEILLIPKKNGNPRRLLQTLL